MLITPLLIKHFLPELKEALSGAKLIALRHQPEKRELILVFKAQPKMIGLLFNYDSQNYHFLIVTDKEMRKLDYPKVENLFSGLIDATLEQIEQIDFDRILKLTFSRLDELKGKERRLLYAEINANLNLILTDGESKILDSLKSTPLDSASSRPVRPGLKYYGLTALKKSDPNNLSPAEWKKFADSAKPQTLLQFLTSRFLGIDKLLAEELLFRAKLSGDSKVAELEDETLRRLGQMIEKYLSQDSPAISIFDSGPVWSPFSRLPFSVSPHFFQETALLPPLNEALREFFRLKSEADKFSREKANILARLEKNIGKIGQSLQKVDADIREKSNYPEYKEIADLILMNKDSLKKGQSQVLLRDLYAENPADKTVLLNPELSPLQNAQSYYKKSQRAKTGLVLLEKRKKHLHSSLEILSKLKAQVDGSPAQENLEKLKPHLIKLGVTQPAGAQTRKKRQEKRLFREFQTKEGWKVLVGRNNRENDLLTFKTAQSEDYWFHASGIPGSHVVLRRENKKSQPSPAALQEAASIAAYFSKGRNSKKVEVVYTLAKYVRKPQKAKPGQALVEREKSILVTPKLPEKAE